MSDAAQPDQVSIEFLDLAGKRYLVSACHGQTLMQVATENAVEGIGGACGGCCACGTCLVEVEPQLASQLPPISAEEEDLVSFVGKAGKPLRLGCQIQVSACLAGAVLKVAVE